MRHGRTRPREKRLGLLLLPILGLVGWVAACTSTAADAPSTQAQPYTFYLGTWTENSDEDQLVPLDPETLEDRPGGKTLKPGTLSADGSTRVVAEYSEGHNVNSPNLDPEDVWIVVQDVPSGAERRRFHPPASGLISDLSKDGVRLLLQPYPYPTSHYPPAVEWYVVDTTSGELLAHIKDADNACYRQRAYFDPAGQRIFCAVDPDLTGADEPQAMQIVAYDVASGLRAEELELPWLLIGGSTTERSGQMVWEFLEPALSLSPDGQRLAVVHADADKITLIDAHSLSVEKTISLQRDTRRWDWFGLAPAVAHAKGEMQGSIRHVAFSADGQHLYVFSQEVRPKMEDVPAERGLWLVDLAQERIAAKALSDYQIQWVRPAPDNTAYVFGTTDERLLPYEIRMTSPSMLWRVDGRTLEILAQRPFTGYRGGWLVGGSAALPTDEATSTNVPYADCPVTQPPESPFIPPDLWPAQPPGPDRFWYGNSGLWTALPAGGSWRQLALGEKFWWWSEEFDVVEDETPDLTMTARRLDGDAPTFRVTEATNGYHESFNWAMLVGVELASPGCWEFTGEYKSHQLSFVLWVPPK